MVLGLDFENAESLDNQDYERLTGVSKNHFHEIVSICEKDVEKGQKSLRTPIALLLMKLRTGNSSAELSSLFRISKSCVDKYISKARKILTKQFLPHYLGISKKLFSKRGSTNAFYNEQINFFRSKLLRSGVLSKKSYEIICTKTFGD